MKKIYTIPLMETEIVEVTGMLAQSGVTGDNGIGYGGTDNSGTLDIEVKEEILSIFLDE